MATNQKKRKKKKARGGIKPIQWILVVLLFAALIFVISVLLGGKPEENNDPPEPTKAPDAVQLPEGSFAAGTKVNGVNISGMTSRDAMDALEESLEAQLDEFSLDLHFDGSTWTMDRSVCKLTTNVDQVLSDAAKSGGTFSTAITVEPENAEKYLKSIAVDINCTPVEPELVFDPTLAVPVAPAPTEEPDTEAPEATPAPAVVPFTISGGENGASLNVDASVEVILNAVAEGKTDADLVVDPIEPSVTMENMQSSVALISSFSTSFSTRDSGRTHNLKLAAEKLNGTVIAPNTTFSFNEVVGPRDEANGWREAKVIIGGSRYEDGWGGGICQVSTTLYNSLLLTGVDFASFGRVNHSIPSDYVPKGLDATVAYGSKDFTFTNNTGSSLYVVAFTTDTDKSNGSITFQIYGPALAEGTVVEVNSDVVNTLNPPDPEIIYDSTEPPSYKVELQKERKGYVVDVTRTITVNGTVQKEEKLYSDTYKAVQGIFTVGTAEETAVIPEDAFIPVE